MGVMCDWFASREGESREGREDGEREGREGVGREAWELGGREKWRRGGRGREGEADADVDIWNEDGGGGREE